MTQRTCWSAIALALWFTCSLPLAADEPTEWVRQAVLFKTPEVRLREKLDDQAPVVEKPTAALWFYVVEAQDGWLRVDGGWVHSNDVVRKSEAVEYFTAEIQRDPTAFAHACRCRAWTDAKEFDKAIADADAALQLDANYAPAFFARARAWEGKEDFTHTLTDLNECLRLESLYDPAFRARSDIHVRQGNHDQAIRELDEALRLRPRDADLLQCRADVFAQKGDAERALADYAETLSLEPRNVDALYGRAYVWNERGEWDKAIADINTALALEPSAASAEVFAARGRCQATLGRIDLALADYSEAIRLDSKFDQAFLGRAWAWYNKRDLDKALADLDEALRLEPNSAEAYANRCGIWVEKKEFDKALADADEAVRLAPTSSQAFSNRAAARMGICDWDGAISDSTEAIRLDPTNATAYNNRGRVWKEKKEFKRAIADLNEAIRLTPNSAEFRCHRAACWLALSYVDKAIADADDALRLDPKLVAAYNLRASAWIKQAKYDQAIADAEAALRLDPQNATALGDRGAARAGKGEFDPAITDLTEALRLDPTLAMSFNNRGAAYLGKDDFENARRDFDQAIELNPNNALAYKNRAKMWARQNNNEAAIADLGEYLRLRPDDAVAYAKRARLWLKQGELDGAITDFSESLRLDPKQPDVLVERGRARIDQGDIDEGIADCTTALELNDKHVDAYRNRAWCWGSQNEWDKVISDCAAALRHGPKDAWTHYYRGFAYLHKEQLDAALEDLNEAIRLDPKMADAYTSRALVYEQKGRMAEARHDREEAERLNPPKAVATYGAGEPLYQPQSDEQALVELREALRKADETDRGEALNALAWKLATCPNERCRNGKEAVELAQQAVAAMPGNWYVLDTLAAAHAENGDFPEAVRCQEQALQTWQRLPADGTQRFEEFDEGLDERLLSYRAGKPYREPQPATVAYTLPRTLSQGTIDLLKQGRQQLNQWHLNEALAAFNTVIERDPKQAKSYFWRSQIKSQQNQFDVGLAEALFLDSQYVEALRERARTWQKLGKLAEGLADLNAALRIAPENGLYLLDRGRFHVLLGDYVAGLADFDRALDLASDETDVFAIQVERARLLAGCPDDTLRSGKLALEAAEAAQAASKYLRASCVEALAAAHAECGNFAEAVEWQTKAVELAPNGPDREEWNARLELYRAGKTFRLPPPAQTKAAEANATEAKDDKAHVSVNAGIELNDVSADSILVIAVRPSEIAQSNGAEALIAAINSFFGLQVHTVADLVEIKAAFTDFGPNGRQPRGYAVLRSKAALDWHSFALDLFGTAKGSANVKREHAGNTYFVVNPQAAYYMADERTMVTAWESQIEEVIEKLSRPQAKITWANRWRRIADGQLALMVDLKAIDKRIGSELFLGLRADDSLTVDAEFYCDSPECAEKVRAILNALLTLAGNLLDKQSGDSPELDDGAKPALILAKLARVILNRAELTCDDKIVQWRSQVKFDRMTDSKPTSGESDK